MPPSIILIGPMRAGKTTVGRLLAEAVNLPQLSLDQIKKDLFPTYGYDQAQAAKIRQEHGVYGVLAYWKPFEARLVEEVLQAHPHDTVIDFGAGHSVFDDPALFERVENALKPFPLVLYLTPTPDAETNIKILHQRDLDDGESGLPEFNHDFVCSDCNSRLATHTFYTHERTPEQTRDAILAVIGS